MPDTAKHYYVVHTIGGEKLTIWASGYSFDHADNRVNFADVDEAENGQWTVFLSGVAAIHRVPPEKPTENWSRSELNL